MARDSLKVDRSELGAEKYFETDDYVDYKIADNRYLRLRLLHPDKADAIIGADLLYERYNMNNDTVRIAALQYKVWEKYDTLNFRGEDDRSVKQMKRLEANLCNKRLCQEHEKMKGKIDFRFPYCAGFLRPTDRQQPANVRMISSGIHIPICSALRMANDDGRIVKKEIRHTALTHSVFEHLFNHGLIGSRSMSTEELEEFYLNLKLFENNPTLTLYAKEIITKSSR